MKGYRTIIFSAFMTLAGIVGWKISPAAANQWTDVFVVIWGIGGILIRQVTNTPVGKSYGLDKSEIAQLGEAINTLLQHSNATLGAAQLTANMSQKFDAIAAALQMVASAAPQPDPAAAIAPAVAVASASGGAALTPSEAELAPVSAPAVPVAAPAPVAAPVAARPVAAPQPAAAPAAAPIQPIAS